MQLSAKILKNVDGLNAWAFTESWSISRDGDQGEPATFYFQLIDTDRDDIRHIPGALAEMVVTFPAINDEEVLVKTATNPFPEDRSIWAVTILASDLPQGGVVRFALTDGGVTRKFSVIRALQVRKVNAGGC